jgi:hypothetical protein
MEERESFVLSPNSAIIDGPEDAIKNLNIAISLLGAIVREHLINSDEPVDNDTVDALGIVEASVASIDMWLERLGK